MTAKPKLTLAFPCKFQIHARFAMTLFSVIEELRTLKTEWAEIRYTYLMGKSNIAHARSVMLTEWYDASGGHPDDGFFFIDSDHTFTAEDVLRVTRLKGDLNAGIYCNRAKDPTSFPVAGGFDEKAENIPLQFAGTGFLFFRRKSVAKIHDWMRSTEGLDRLIISDIPGTVEFATIPFFQEVVCPPRPSDGRRFWLGEDYSFCYRARQAGLSIMGCFSTTLGHEIPYVVFPDKPRRGPVTWPENTIAIYCGPVSAPAELVLEGILLGSRGHRVVLFSKDTQEESGAVEFKRYEEFQAHDNFHCLVLWDGTLDTIQGIGPATKRILVSLQKRVERIPLAIQRSSNVLVSPETDEFYAPLIPAGVRFRGKLSELL